MASVQLFFMVLFVVACVLGSAFTAMYFLNKIVDKTEP